MTKNLLKHFLEHKAYTLRVDSLVMTSIAGSGHPTSCLSAADIVAALFFYAMHYDPQNPANPNNDRFILSKGHASPILYAAWKEAGVLSEQDLLTYRNIDSVLEGHPTLRFKYSEAATGSLGMGLSIGVGMALSAQLDKRSFYTYVLMGDSEITEGSVWEAAEVAAFYKLNNLVAIVDCNRLGQSTATMHGHHTQRYAAKFEAFGWHALVIDGHDMQDVMAAFDKVQQTVDRPVVIIAKTFKGYGIAEIENKEGYHGKAFKKEELNQMLAELETHFKRAAFFDDKAYRWQPQLPAEEDMIRSDAPIQLPATTYKIGQMISTRKAYGQSLVELGRACEVVVSLDAEVKNSTFAEFFEQKFPTRFFQCFIAEQNMVSMAVGFDRRGKIPFVSTFGAFFSRAYDQIRMAAVGTASIRLVGSHAGVSIGQDGPSQMALEDIALMRALPGSAVLYPSDAVCTHALVAHMANYKGISYLRTTRMDTPVLYDVSEDFPIGGCKVLRSSDQDVACIVAAGVTLFEALRAYEQLAAEGIFVSVIDVYSVKPLDEATLKSVGSACGNRMITVEDHYLQGGLGQAVMYALRTTDIKITCLAVTELPRSGKPEELLAWAGIDADAIIKAVKNT